MRVLVDESRVVLRRSMNDVSGNDRSLRNRITDLLEEVRSLGMAKVDDEVRALHQELTLLELELVHKEGDREVNFVKKEWRKSLDDTAPEFLKHDTPTMKCLPRHIAFICDGNSRWSMQRRRSLTTMQREEHRRGEGAGKGEGGASTLARSMMGHISGAHRVVGIINSLLLIREDQRHNQRQILSSNHPHDRDQDRFDDFTNNNIQYCTLFAFSTENWSRPSYEIAAIFALIERISRRYRRDDASAIHGGRVQIRLLGDVDDVRIPQSTREELRKLERTSADACRYMATKLTTTTMRRTLDNNDDLVVDVDNDDDHHHYVPLTISLAINYGGRADILRAAREYSKSIIDAYTLVDTEDVTIPTMSRQQRQLLPHHPVVIDETELSKRLCTSGMPDVDLIIRTGGERRLSNFFLWEGAYAELYFCDTLWPDFDDVALEEALVWYGNRQRRFGGR